MWLLAPIFAILLVPVAACSSAWAGRGPEVVQEGPAPLTRPAAEARLAASRRLLVQLQGLSFASVERADPDVLVVDYAWDGGPATELTPADVARLRAGRRIVLAYLSVGEAEEYRFYWRNEARGGRARFVDRRNPDWPGDWLVRYWDPDWQAVLYGGPGSYLSRIMAAGFDGVYLDTVDSAEVFEERGDGEAAARMADLVVALADAARARVPGFLVVAQNPFKILGFPRAVAAMSGAVGEAVAFKGESVRAKPELEGVLRPLRDLHAAGKTVMMLEYVRSTVARGRFAGICADEGFLCYVGGRGLGRVGFMLDAGRTGGTAR